MSSKIFYIYANLKANNFSQNIVTEYTEVFFEDFERLKKHRLLMCLTALLLHE